MKKMIYPFAILMLSTFGLSTVAQEKPKDSAPAKTEERTTSPIPLRVQVVFTEYDGDKKIVSLPYSFTVNADEHHARPDTQIRDGARIPIFTNKDQNLQYLDVGTNIDCSAQTEGEGRYKLVLTVERSSVSQESSPTNAPVTRQFRTEINPILRDGQTLESVMATDPVNGHIYRVTVTLNVPK
ncbi:MAG TPA: hypothetical protein VLX32_00375 [Candidatus Acidoferrum sp.]|nr:hypothetical protein [Candidatus Acidoferrum sp.]